MDLVQPSLLHHYIFFSARSPPPLCHHQCPIFINISHSVLELLICDHCHRHNHYHLSYNSSSKLCYCTPHHYCCLFI